MRSIFIGIWLFMAYVIFCPVTILWHFGERQQGRQGCAFVEEQRWYPYIMSLTHLGKLCMVSMTLHIVLWTFVVVHYALS